MDGLFQYATAGEQSSSVRELERLLAQHIQGQLTGIVEIAYPPQIRLFFLLVQGELKNSYLVTPELIRKIQYDEWTGFLGKAEAQARVLTLPLEAIRAAKLLIECPAPAGSFPLPTRELVRRIDGWSTSNGCMAIRIVWPAAEGVMVFPGKDGLVQPALFITHGQIVTETDAIIAITHWKEATCTISQLVDDDRVEAWKEYRLRLAFTRMTELLLTRYKELAGQSLVSSLNQDIDDETLRRGWRISCVGNGMIDHHIFASPQEAADAYRELSRLLLAHLDAVLGSRITHSLAAEIFDEIDADSQEILRSYRLLLPPDSAGLSPEMSR